MLQTIFLYLFCQWSFLQYNSYYLITCRREVLVLLWRGGQESAQQGVGGVWRDLWSQRHRGRLPGHRWGHRDHDLHQERSDSGIKSIYLCVKIPDHKCKIKTPNCLLEYLLVSCFMEVRSGSKLDPFRIQQLCGSGSTQLKWRKARQTDKNSPSLFRLFFERYGMPLKPKKLQEYNYIFLLQIDNASVWNLGKF